VSDGFLLFLLLIVAIQWSRCRSGADILLDRKQVHEFYEAALKAGGKDNGAPGERFYHAGYYAAFVRSPAGHNIEAVIRGPDQE
jgi:hypothetical protein